MQASCLGTDVSCRAWRSLAIRTSCRKWCGTTTGPWPT
jgi:hypothetical protein